MTKPFSRRHFLKNGSLMLGAVAAAGAVPLTGISAHAATVRQANQEAAYKTAQTTATQAVIDTVTQPATVFFTRDLSAEGLAKLYAKVNGGLTGKVAIKLHTGEPNAPNILPREWVKALLPLVPSPTIVECNVLYPSPRQHTESHRKTLQDNGWTFCPVDIMDADGDERLPVRGGKWIKDLAVGKSLVKYDSMLVLSHFKGHSSGGFGGALKNISIGCASGKVGKEQLHREGSQLWAGGPNFMERMVEGGKAITDHFGPRITYINVLRSMSVDCDCAGAGAEAVVTPDIGIVASTDILAVDQASVDLVYALPTAQKKALVERIESRSGLRQLTYMQELGMGTAKYTLVTV